MTTTDSNPQDGQVTEDAPKQETTTMAEEMKKAFREAEQKETEDASSETGTEVPAEEGETSVSEEATEAEREDNDEGEDGRVDEDDDALSEEEAEAKTEEDFPLIPNNWSEQEKEAFQDLLDSDDEDKRVAAEILLERYNSFKKTYFKKTEELASQSKEMKPIIDLFQPFEATMTTNGVDKATYIKNMITWEMSLQRDPVNTLKQIAQKFNVPLENLSPQRKRDEYDFDEEDLTESLPNGKVNELEQEIAQLRTQIANQPIEAQIRQFEVATDAEGKLLHPHFAEVKPIMGQLIQQSGNTLTLENAYKKAIKVLDVNVEAESDDTETAIDLDKIRQKVKKAKKASKGVTTKGGKTDFTSMTLKDELKARMKP